LHARYPFGECLLLHFADAYIIDIAENIELFNKIEEILNSNANANANTDTDTDINDRIR
jgi:hypothetical protein